MCLVKVLKSQLYKSHFNSYLKNIEFIFFFLLAFTSPFARSNIRIEIMIKAQEPQINP